MGIPFKKGVAFTFTIPGLGDQLDSHALKTNPAIALGDFKLLFDGAGSFANMSNTPTVPDATGPAVVLSFTEAEANHDEITVWGHDAVDSEWDDIGLTFTTDTKQIGELSTVTTAQVNAECDAALADYDPPTKGEMDTGLAGLNDLSAAEVNAQVDIALVDYDPPTKGELDAALAALNDPSASAIALAVGQRQIPDAYAADGAQPTIEQAILAIHQFLQERVVASTTVTVKKPDGSTAAMTFTLNDAANPTSITRAS